MQTIISVFILTSFLAIFFQNCSPPKFGDVRPATESPILDSDPTFKPYIQEFETLHGHTTAYVPVAFADLTNDKWAGVCHYSYAGDGSTYGVYVLIDKDYWPKMTEYQKMNLIFHELGHCVLNRDHVPSDSVSECPSSFMYEQVMSTYCIQKNYQAYIKEMFP